MTPRQRELLDIIAATVHAARRACDELALTIPEHADARGVVQDMTNSLHGIADDARAEHASGLLCEVFEGLKGPPPDRCSDESCGCQEEA